MRRWMGMALAACCCCSAQAEPVYRQAKAEEVHVREGVGNVLAKIREGKPITVAYLGGSITAMNGWRNKTTDWLRKTYPQNQFKEIHASIGGTGSELGVFRVGHDALSHNPDLLFVEFATNDGGRQPKDIWKSMEGIVRQTWRKDPKTDIVFTYTITAAMTNDYCRGMCNRAASAMEQLADHYGIPSIGFGPRVAKLINENKLLMGPQIFEAQVPKDAPDRRKRIEELAKKDGRLLFANDTVHPRDAGHELYLQSIINGFTQMKDSKPADHAAKMKTPFVEDNMENAKMVPITRDLLSGTWEKLPATDPKMRGFSNRMGEIWYSGTPGSSLSFKYRGYFAAVYDLLGPDGGQVQISVDGVPFSYKTKRFDSYCTYHRIATLHTKRFPMGNEEHTVTITIDPEQPSRQPVAFRLKNPEVELKGPKYQGTKVWFSKLMLIGDLVKE